MYYREHGWRDRNMGKGKQNNSTNTAKNYNVGTMQYAIATVNDCFGYIKSLDVDVKLNTINANNNKEEKKKALESISWDKCNPYDQATPKKIKTWARAQGLWKEGLVEVTVNVEVNEEVNNSLPFDFFVKLDIDGDHTSVEQAKVLQGKFEKLNILIEENRSAIDLFKQVKSYVIKKDEVSFTVPTFIIDLYDENKKPRTDYQNVVIGTCDCAY